MTICTLQELHFKQVLMFSLAAYFLASLLIEILNAEAAPSHSNLINNNIITYNYSNNGTSSDARAKQSSFLEYVGYTYISAIKHSGIDITKDTNLTSIDNSLSSHSLRSYAVTTTNNTNNSSKGSDNQLCVEYYNRSRTVNLCGGIVSLSVLSKILDQPEILNHTSERDWLLNANIIIANGATLVINSEDTASLRINSTGATAYSIMVEGNLLIDKTRISSWNSAANADTPLEIQGLPRSYLFVPRNSTGQMNITNSNISNLGFASTKDTWGISYYSGIGSKIENNTIYSNFRGVHLAPNASNISIANNTIHDSLQYGLNLYGAKHITVSDNEISNSGYDGIICSHLCGHVLVQSNRISNNSRNGIMLSDQSSNSSLHNNSIFDNKRSGVSIYNSHNNTVSNNNIRDNGVGLTITQASHSNSINKNSIIGSLENGLTVRGDSKENHIVKNAINISNGPGMYVKDSRNNLFVKNNVTENSNNGILFSNASKNIMVSNDISNNQRYNYYSKTNSSYNVLRDTFFDNETLRFFDNSNSIVLQDTDNKVIQNNKKIPVSAYPKNTTIVLSPITKNVVVNSTDMFVTPSSGHINISSLSKDFTSNLKSKKWLEMSLSSASAPQASTKYVIGKFLPNTQIMVKVNGSFWNAYTTNDSGHITFIYDSPAGINAISNFEADTNNSAAIATVVLFTSIAIGAAALIILTPRLTRKIGKQKIGRRNK